MKTPHITLESLKKSSWSRTDLENVTLVVEFVQKLMNEHDFDSIVKTFGEGAYRQHNRSMKDGIDGVVKAVADLTKRFPEFSYEVKQIHVDGGYVTVHSHATMRSRDRGNEKKGFIIFDTWRVVDGRIVEHWDALQPLDIQMRLYTLFTGGSIRNDNGIF